MNKKQLWAKFNKLYSEWYNNTKFFNEDGTEDKDFDIDFLPVQDQLYHGTQFALLHMFPKTRSLNGDMLHLLIRRICINSNIENCKQSLYDIMNELYPNQTIKSNPTYKNKENNGLKEVK